MQFVVPEKLMTKWTAEVCVICCQSSSKFIKYTKIMLDSGNSN